MLNLVSPYNPDWKNAFEDLKISLEAALHGCDIEIQHVGSTCIPGLCAKPILDIDIIMESKKDIDVITARLEEIGYISKGEQGIADRFAFRQYNEFTPLTPTHQKWHAHHLYVCLAGSVALQNHLLFRDALMKNKALVEMYSALKLSLMKEKGMTRESYTQRKTEFILSVLGSAGLDEKKLNEIKIANL